MKRLLFLFLLISSVAHGQRYFYSRATLGGSSSYAQILDSDVPSNFLRSATNNTITGTTTFSGAGTANIRFGQPGNEMNDFRIRLDNLFEIIGPASSSFSINSVGDWSMNMGINSSLSIGGNAGCAGCVLTSDGTNIHYDEPFGLPFSGTALNQIRRNEDGTAWEEFTPYQSPGVSNGDLAYFDADNDEWVSLPIGTSGQLLSVSSITGLPVWQGSGASSISGLTGATGTNSINNNAYTQTWAWNGLTSQTGIFLSSSSTGATSNSQQLLGASLSGANSNSSQTTTTVSFSNTHTGTGSVNQALSVSASGGATNIGLNVSSGEARFNSLTSGRVALAGANGALTSDAGLTFSTASGQLTANRTTTGTAAEVSLVAKATKTTAMSNGFGAGLIAVNRDNDNVDNFVGYIYFPRSNNNDATADISFNPYTAGTPNERFRIGYDGTITASGLSGSGPRMVIANSSGVLSTQAIPSGSYSQVVDVPTTTFTVTIGTTMANSTYKVAVTPTSSLSAALFYVNNKTTTTFDVVYLAGLTGTVTFDWIIAP